MESPPTFYLTDGIRVQLQPIFPEQKQKRMTCALRHQNEMNPLKWDEFVYANSMGWAYYLYEKIRLDRCEP